MTEGNPTREDQRHETPGERLVRKIREIPPDVLDDLNAQFEAERRWYDGKRAHEFVEDLIHHHGGEVTLLRLKRWGHKDFLYRDTYDRLLADRVIERCTLKRGQRMLAGFRVIRSEQAEKKRAEYKGEAQQAESDYEIWKNAMNTKRFGYVQADE